jgi:dTDP-4-amino-4,6-dideoxygalactose transaminase
MIGDEEIAEVVDTLRSGWLTTGPKTERFEAALKDYVGAGYGVAVNSCTAALHVALHVLGIGPGDGVVTSPFTFASTGHTILYVGARPFLVDVEPDTFNLDPVALKEFLENECVPDALTGRPRHVRSGTLIRAIVPVHYGGHACRMDDILALARKHQLFVVEDAAHALGTRYNGQPIGSFGDITCFSFYATKNVAAGEGGMAVTQDQALAARMRVLAMYGISDARRIWTRYAPKGSWVYDVQELGFKYNMMDIQAALGIHQLAKLEGFIQRREENARAYDAALKDIPGVEVPVVKPYTRHARHLYPLLLPPSMDRDAFIERLKAYNIGSSVLFIPLHYHSLYRRELEYREGAFPTAESVFRRIVCLPVAPAHSAAKAAQAADIVAGLIRMEA